MDIIIKDFPPGWDMDSLIEELKECMYGMGNTGICVECGSDQGQVEPDAQGYECQGCGQHTVCGVEHIFISLCP